MALTSVVLPNIVYPSWAKLAPDGRVAIYLDNLLLSEFGECEQKFCYHHVMHRLPKGTGGVSATMKLGIWWSETLERFYKGMMDYQRKEPNSIEPSDTTLIKAAIKAWFDLNMATGATDQPGTSFQEVFPTAHDRFGGVEGAAAMAEQYWDVFGEFDARHWTIIAMEAGFGLADEVLLYEDEEIIVYWCGRPDLNVYEDNTDQLMPVEHKTVEFMVSNFIQKWKPHSQTAGYVFTLNELCGKLGFNRAVDRCVINGAARLVAIRTPKGGPKPRFLRPRTHYSLAELKEFKEQTALKARNLWDAYLDNIWIKNERACHLYAGCMYRGVCSMPPASRLVVLEANYNEVEPWVPYIYKKQTVNDPENGEDE